MSADSPTLKLDLPSEKIAEFCRRWRIIRLEAFGSALRADFRENSDVDLLATYSLEAHWSLLDRVRMKYELEALLGREVDLLNRRAMEKSGRGRAPAILAEAELVYAES